MARLPFTNRKYPLAEFRNPNLQAQGGEGGGGGDMRGLLSITLLALVVLLGFQFFSKPKQPATTAPAAQTQHQTQPAQQAASTGQSAQPQLTAGQVQPPSVATPAIAASAVAETTVENENYKIVFTNQGAQVTHWILKGKQYKDHPDPGGQQLDLVNPKTADAGLPLSLYTYCLLYTSRSIQN